MSQQFGKYSKSRITAVPADLKSPEALYFKQTIPSFPDEAVYIYSFKEGRMLYAHGWEEVLGYRDEEITMLLVVNLTAPEFVPFSMEFNDKALMFIQQKTENLEQYGFSMELKKIHRNGATVPMITRVNIFQAEAGNVVSIMGRLQVNRSINFGKVMRYATFGPEKDGFEEELNQNLFYRLAISDKEKRALAYAAQGYSYKEMAEILNVTQSAIEKRILAMYKRFDVKNLPHLVSFAYENYILP